MAEFAKSEFFVTEMTKGAERRKPDDELKCIEAFVVSEQKRYSDARMSKEDTWLECWAAYLGSPQAIEHIRAVAQKTVGDVQTDWRHKVNTGKAFENVETIVSYLQAAFFPNRDWFEFLPLYQGTLELADLIKTYLQGKLKESGFQQVYEMFVRQATITGWSVLALPWRRETIPYKKRVKVVKDMFDETGVKYGQKVDWQLEEKEKVVANSPEFEVLSVFDCWIDPDAVDVNKGNFIRRMTKTKGEVFRMVQHGMYPELTKEDVVKMCGEGQPFDPHDTKKGAIANFHGMAWTPTKTVNLYEFWGDVTTEGDFYSDVVATLIDGKLGRFENNPYWAGRPFVIAHYTPIVHSPYGVGAIEPVLGLLHQLHVVTNQRLDNLELSTNSMWTLVDDGTTNPEDVFTEPGRVIPVGSHESLQPVQQSTAFTVTYQESAVLEGTIDKTVGTGAFVGSGQGRTGERVTATEVQAVQDAGGNRLSSVHRWLEHTALLVVLQKVYRSCQQFVTEDEVVRITGAIPGSYYYVQVGQDELQHEFAIEALGASHIADKEFDMNKWMQFIQMAQNNPQTSQVVDWTELMKYVSKRFLGLNEVDRFIKAPQQPVNPDGSMPGSELTSSQPAQDALQPTLPGMPGQEDMMAAQAALEGMGGQPALNWGKAQLQGDQGQAAFDQTLSGLGIESPANI